MTGNLYTSRQLMINSGQFWRCTHGYTKFTTAICWRCALARPLAFWRNRFAR